MRLHRVTDCELNSALSEHYDLAILASGYEERSTFIPKLLKKSRSAKHVVLGFKEVLSGDDRSANDRYFADHWTGTFTTTSSDDDRPVYTALNALLQGTRGVTRILVDYSSMSRLWYAAILNWVRYACQTDTAIVDLLYAVGDHREHASPLVITDVSAIPGCEGGSGFQSQSIGVFGLGFDGSAALCVLDRLEPDKVFAYLADPAAHDDYPQRALTENDELVKKHSGFTLPLPLNSVERTFRSLAELILPHLDRDEITFVPMGPKPHVLAAILLAMRFQNISCLRVSGRREPPEQVGTTGQVVGTRVEFKRERALRGLADSIAKVSR